MSYTDWNLWEGSKLTWKYNDDGNKTNETTLCGKKFVIRADHDKKVWDLVWWHDHPFSGSIVEIEDYLISLFTSKDLELEYKKYHDLFDSQTQDTEIMKELIGKIKEFKLSSDKGDRK